jgi:hypothetical protein
MLRVSADTAVAVFTLSTFYAAHTRKPTFYIEHEL